MDNSLILNFLKAKAQDSKFSFFQYAKRNKLQHLGGTSISEDEFKTYLPNNIKGFTTLEKAMSAEPIKMAYELEPGIKLTYELDFATDIDWVKNGRIIQVGICYKGVNIKLYECVFGYNPHTLYENLDSVEQFGIAKKRGNIHYGINAFVGINEIMEQIEWKTILNHEDNDFPYLEANSIVRHARNAQPSDIIDLFIDEKTKSLCVNDLFAIIMNFGESNIKIDVSNKQVKQIKFYVPYPLCKNFNLPSNIHKIKVSFEVGNEHGEFLKFNRDLLLGAKGLKIDSRLYENMKQTQLNELAQQYCLIKYNGDNLSGAVLSNKMAYKLLVDKLEEIDDCVAIKVPGKESEVLVERKQFLNNLTCIELSLENVNFLKNTMGKTLGVTSWYDPALEGSLFQIQEG